MCDYIIFFKLNSPCVHIYFKPVSTYMDQTGVDRKKNIRILYVQIFEIGIGLARADTDHAKVVILQCQIV